jgi:hypothetical protein
MVLQKNADFSDFEVILSGPACLLYQVEHYLVNIYDKKAKGSVQPHLRTGDTTLLV